MSVVDKIQDVSPGARKRIRDLKQVVPTVARYDSFQAMVRDAEIVPEMYHEKIVRDFSGVHTYAEAVQKAKEGDLELGREAEKMISQLQDQGIFSVGPAALGLDVVGFVPCVPAYLSGHPENMLTNVEADSVRSPIRIFAGIGAGGEITPDEMLQRGIAITALVIALSALRPVELYAYTYAVSGPKAGSHTDTSGICVWPVETRPLDLASVAFQVSHASVHRAFGFSMADAMNQSRCSWRPVPCAGRRDQIEKVSREVFECEPQDLVIPRATNGGDDPLIRDPIAWLKEVLQTHIDGLA